MLAKLYFLTKFFFLLFICFLATDVMATDLPVAIDVVTEEFPPFNYTDNGRLTGYATEVVEAVLGEIGVKGNFHVLPWPRAMHWAQEKENVLIYSIARNEEREKKFKYVAQITEGKNYLYALKSRNIKISSIEDAKKFSVGVIKDDIKEDMLINLGFKLNQNLIPVQINEQNYLKLRAGHIDLWPMNSVTMAYIVRQCGDEPSWFIEPILRIDSIFLYTGDFMAFGPRTSEDVVEVFRQGLNKIKDSGKFKEISEKWEH